MCGMGSGLFNKDAQRTQASRSQEVKLVRKERNFFIAAAVLSAAATGFAYEHTAPRDFLLPTSLGLLTIMWSILALGSAQNIREGNQRRRSLLDARRDLNS